jgi:hypothetical protein
MLIFKGGLSQVRYADNINFTSATVIPGVMKTSKVEFNTPTEENALNKNVAGGKGVSFTVESEDLTESVYTGIVAAEAARTEIYFEFTGINTAQKLVLKKCQVLTHLKPEEPPKNWKRLVIGSGYADSEVNLYALTLS